MKAHHGAVRVGRVARWQRRASYAVLGVCAISGLVWFALMDAADWQPPQLVLWWICHGVAGFLAMLIIGTALPHHVVATWRHHRNRLLGSLVLGSLALLAVSALLLLYGREGWHLAAHWVHVIVGVAAMGLFPWHVLRGRRSVGKKLR